MKDMLSKFDSRMEKFFDNNWNFFHVSMWILAIVGIIILLSIAEYMKSYYIDITYVSFYFLLASKVTEWWFILYLTLSSPGIMIILYYCIWLINALTLGIMKIPIDIIMSIKPVIKDFKKTVLGIEK